MPDENEPPAGGQQNTIDGGNEGGQGGDGGKGELGPEGEKALEAFKTRAREAERKAKAAEAELEKLRIDSLSGQEKAIAQAKAEARAEALKEANGRLVSAEVKALAAELQFADPGDAVHFLDLSSYDDPDTAGKKIKADLAQLLKDKPYLGKGPGAGSGEGGPRGGTQTKDSDGNAWLRQLAGKS